MKRTNRNILTVEARTLRFMRLRAGLSQSEAARRCGVSVATIGHIENGRMDLGEERIRRQLVAYCSSREEFDEYVRGKPIPLMSIREECVSLLGQLDEAKLRAVYSVLLGFTSR
ncbi:MAG: helix-turn-helix domain-containing protein [Bdellovibrionales bacterium]|nr:helix-turn-helix domain-containing protein [Bdellovibrionales bacterium]